MFQSKISSSFPSSTATAVAPAAAAAVHLNVASSQGQHRESDDELASALTFLSKEMEMMGLPGLVTITTTTRDGGGGGGGGGEEAVEWVELVNASFELLGRVRELQKTKRERDEYAQQLLQDLQRCQWLLERQKELCVQRERDAAEACEKERQAGVRLRQVEALLKKKSEEHRQLVGETQLKQSQWQHALRRRDQENHKLHQQLLKFLRTKSGGHGNNTAAAAALVPLELEIRGTLIPPAARMAGAASCASLSTSVRRKWDRAEDSFKFVEDKWKSVVTAMEKEQQILRGDCQFLLELIIRFLTKLPQSKNNNNTSNCWSSNFKDWMQLPMSSIKSRLEEVFNCLEKQSERWMTLASSSSPSANYKGNSFDGVPCRIEQQQQQSVANDVFIQLEAERKALEEDRQRAAAGIWLNPLGDERIITTTAPTCCHWAMPTAPVDQPPGTSIRRMVAARSEVDTGPRQSASVAAAGVNEATSGLALIAVGHHMDTNVARGRPEATAATPISHGVERNDADVVVDELAVAATAAAAGNSDFICSPAVEIGFVRQNTVITRRKTITKSPVPASDCGPTATATQSTVLKTALEQMTSNRDHRSRFVVDTPCPSGSNSRRNSSSSSSSSSSSDSVSSCNGAHERPPATSTSIRLTDEQFFQEWSDAASLVNFSRNPPLATHQSHQQSSLSINGSASITAKVSVLPAKEHQQRPPAAAAAIQKYSNNLSHSEMLLPTTTDADDDNQAPIGLSLKCAVIQSNSNPSPA